MSLLAIIATVAGSAIYRWTFAGWTFFMDEVWVVEMIRAGRFWPGLPQPLLFFGAATVTSRLCGFSESCLRQPALVSALLLTLVPLFAWRRGLLGERAALAWTVLLAFSSPIVFYAGRTKQYPTEALGAALILTAFLAVLAGKARLRVYFAVCAVLVPLLHSMPFVILGTGLALTWFVSRSDRRAAMRVLLGHAALGSLFGLAYLAYIRPREATTARFGDLYDYFRANAEPVFFDGSFRFVVTRTAHWVGHLLNMTPWLIIVAAAAIVFLIVRRHDRQSVAIALACALPPGAVLIASAFEVYPYSEVRLMIFAAPGVFLLFALAMEEVARWSRIAGLVVAAFCIFFVAREVRLQPYNTSYVGAPDLHATYAFIRTKLPAGVPIVCRPTECVPLRFYVPHARIIESPDAAPEVSLPSDPEVWMLLRKRETRGSVLHEEAGIVVSRIAGASAAAE